MIGSSGAPRFWQLAAVLAVLALAAMAVAKGEPESPCVEFWPEARYRAYGYDHIVHLSSHCPAPALCQVSTDVAPNEIKIHVFPGTHVEVLTFRGSPARTFRPRVQCLVK